MLPSQALEVPTLKRVTIHKSNIPVEFTWGFTHVVYRNLVI